MCILLINLRENLKNGRKDYSVRILIVGIK